MKSGFKDYEKQAEAQWSDTATYQEYKEKSKGRSAVDNEKLQRDMMNIFAEFALLDCAPADEAVQQWYQTPKHRLCRSI